MVTERKPTVWEEMVGLAPPKVPGIQPITVPQFITTPTGWIMTPDYGAFISPLGEEFTLAEMQTRLPELGYEGIVYDYIRDLFVPATREQVTQREQTYAAMTAQLAELGIEGFVAPPGTPGAMTLEEYEAKLTDYEALLAEQRTRIETAFQTIFPETTIQDFQQILTAMTVADYMTEAEITEANRAQAEFLTTIQQIGRTPETEFLLQTIFPGATTEDINELFAQPTAPTPAPIKLTRKEAKDIYDQKMRDIYNKYPKAPYTREQMAEPWYKEMMDAKDASWHEYQAMLPGIEESIYAKVMNAINVPFEIIGLATKETMVGGWNDQQKALREQWSQELQTLGKATPANLLERQALAKKYEPQITALEPQRAKENIESFRALPWWEQMLWESPAFLDIFPSTVKLAAGGISALTSKGFEIVLNAGLDKWIATTARGNPEAQNWIYRMIVRNKPEIVEMATNNLLKRMGRTVNTQTAFESAVNDTMREIEAKLLPVFTPGGTAIPGQTISLTEIMAGARAELQPLSKATWDALTIPDRVAFAVSKGLAGAIGSKAWEALTAGEIAKLQTVVPKIPVTPEVMTQAQRGYDLGAFDKITRDLQGKNTDQIASYYAKLVMERGDWLKEATQRWNLPTKDFWAMHEKVTQLSQAKPAVAIPKAEVGMPEAGVQPSMIPEVVSGKEVFPRGKGEIVQISMEDQAKLREAWRVAEEALVDVRGAYEAQAEIEGLKVTHEADPVATYRFQMGTKIVGKAPNKKLIPNMVGLDSLISIREQSFPNYFTVKQAQALNPHRDFTKYTQTGLPTYNKVPRDETLDEIAEKLGYTSDTIGDRVMQIRQEKARIRELESEIKTQMTEKPLIPQTDLTAKEVTENWLTMGQPKLNMKQVDALVSVFAEYIESPTAINAWELTRELRRETRAARAENLKARAQELVISQGITTEEAINQAITETLSGELPAITTQYFEGITNELRDAFFVKVYHVLKDEPYEMASTVTALTNALMGKPIPREPGVKGGSAYTRLQRVFGDQPKVLKAIDKMASEKKPLSDVAERIYQVIGGEAIPIDQEMADYLRKLQDIPQGYRTLLEPDFEMPTVSDLRSPAEVEYARAKLELIFKLSEGKITKDAYDIELAIAREKAYPTPPVTKYEIPIEDAIRQIPLWPAPARDAVIRVLKEMVWSPVDIGGFIKAMKSSVDMSYWRQITPLIPNHKVRFGLSNVDAWKALFSQKSAEASWLRILHDPEEKGLYAIYDALQAKTGRDFLRPLDLPKGTSQWKGVEEFGYLTKNRLIPRLTAKIPTIKWSNRAFVSGCNSMAWGCFKDFYRAQLRIAEKYASGELTLEAGKSFDIMDNMDAYATMICDWTGRAGLGKLAQTAPILGNIFYAPRFALGRLISPRHLFSANPYVRREAWKDAAMFIGVIGGTLVLGHQLGFWDLETDRNSADYGKIRIGNLRIDPWGGVQQFFVFFSRVFDLMMVPVTGQPAMGVTTTTGAKYPLNFLSVFENFIKSKEAPLAALFLEYITGKTYGGEKVDVKNIKQWADRIAPMSIQDIWEGIVDQPGTWVIAGIFSFMGFGVQTYTGDWNQNISKLGLPKYSENLPYGMTQPVYDWADFYSDVASQFKGVDPATLTEAKGFDPKVRLIVETARSLEVSSIIPNMTLISLNADPAKGKTFADYYKIWQERLAIVASGDEKALKAFDADERHNQAYMGNISQRQFTLLTEYWSITDKSKQADFLASHPELSQNPREEWLRSNPEENAKQALAGKAKVMTQKAYDIAQKLIKDYDIPDSAVAQYLPPADIAKSYFERNDIVSKWGANSWEDKLLRAKNPELVEWLNKTGNPLGDVDTPIASLELKVKNRDLFDKLDAFSDEDSPDYIADDKARAEAIKKFKTDNPEFVDDMRRIEAIEKGTNEAPTNDALVNAHVEYGKIIDKEGVGSSSAEAMLYRVDNPDYNTWRMNTDVWGDNALKPIDESRIPIWRIDVKYTKEDAEYQAILDKYEGREESARTKTYLEAHSEYRDDRRRRDAYDIDFPQNLIEDYVEWYTNPKLEKPEGLEGTYFEDDWWLMEHPEFHAAMVALGIWKEPRDFSKVPTREVWGLYQTYQFLAGADERLAFRIAHPDLDAWLVETKGYKPAAGRVRGEVESWREELARKLAELHRLIAEMKEVIPK